MRITNNPVEPAPKPTTVPHPTRPATPDSPPSHPQTAPNPDEEPGEEPGHPNCPICPPQPPDEEENRAKATFLSRRCDPASSPGLASRSSSCNG